MNSDNRRFLAVLAGAGALCGGALIVISRNSTNGWLMLVPYVVLAAVAVLCLRGGRVSFGARFSLALTGYVVATAIIESYFLLAPSRAIRPPSFHNLAGPMLVMLLIGCAASVVVAAASRPRKVWNAS